MFIGKCGSFDSDPSKFESRVAFHWILIRKVIGLSHWGLSSTANTPAPATWGVGILRQSYGLPVDSNLWQFQKCQSLLRLLLLLIGWAVLLSKGRSGRSCKHSVLVTASGTCKALAAFSNGGSGCSIAALEARAECCIKVNLRARSVVVLRCEASTAISSSLWGHQVRIHLNEWAFNHSLRASRLLRALTTCAIRRISLISPALVNLIWALLALGLASIMQSHSWGGSRCIQEILIFCPTTCCICLGLFLFSCDKLVWHANLLNYVNLLILY